MLTGRALIVTGVALFCVSCGADGNDDTGGQLRVAAPARAEVTIAKLEPADPLPTLRAAKRETRSTEQSETTDKPAPESTGPAPQRTQPTPQSPPSTPKRSPTKPKPDSGDDEFYLE